MRSLGMKLLAFTAAAKIPAPGFGQSGTQGARADVGFELIPKIIIDSPLGKQMGFADMLAAKPPGAPDFQKIERLFAGVIAPESAETVSYTHLTLPTNREV